MTGLFDAVQNRESLPVSRWLPRLLRAPWHRATVRAPAMPVYGIARYGIIPGTIFARSTGVRHRDIRSSDPLGPTRRGMSGKAVTTPTHRACPAFGRTIEADCHGCTDRRSKMTLGTVLLILLVLLLIGAIPSWPHSRSWGYAPSGVLGLILLIVVILLLLGRI